MSELTQYLVQSVPQLRASGAPKDNALDGVLVLAQEQLGEGADDLFGGGRESQVGFSTSAYDRVRQTLRNKKEQASLSGQGCDDDFQGQQGQGTDSMLNMSWTVGTRKGALQFDAVSGMCHADLAQLHCEDVPTTKSSQ